MGIFAVMIFIFTLILSPLKVIVISASILTLLCVIYNKLPWWSVIILAISDAAALLLPKLLAIEPIAALNPLSAEMWVVILTVALAIFALIKILFFNRRRVKFLRNTLLVYICSVVLIFSVNFIFKNVLQDHQRGRIEVLLGLKEDIRGAGYNVHQSMIAIGSGGLTGKGYMNGTQTRFGFVPEQETDFIFCTIGEEWGFMGTVITLAIYLFIVCRVLISAGKNSFAFTRIYGYCFACCLLMHVFINVCMTIGLMPVIGIPLPFLSYGGSSILAFTIFLFIFIRLDSEQKTSY
jgi:rod shape determining protein RodA